MKHVCLNGHRIDWESSEILATENDYKKKRLLESFYIHKTDFTFNDKINSFYPGFVQKSMYYFEISSSLDSLLTELFESLIASPVQLVFHSLVCETGYQSPVTCYSKP